MGKTKQKQTKNKLKRNNLYTDLTSFTKISQQITDLNGKHKTIKILEDYVSENRDDLGNDFLDTTPRTIHERQH